MTKKFDRSGTPSTGQHVPDNPRANDPDAGETAHRQSRPRAPQFGTDRRNPRDLDVRRPASARHDGDHNGLPQKSGGEKQLPERRKAPRDRRQSHS